MAGLGQRGIPPPQQRQVEPLVAKFFIAKNDQKSTKIGTKSPKNRPQFEQNRKNAPKSAQERHSLKKPQSSSALGAVLSRSWEALGPPQAAPNATKSAKIRARSQFFHFFLNVIFHINFCIVFFSNFHRFFEALTLKNKRFASTGARFSQNRRFRILSQISSKFDSVTP